MQLDDELAGASGRVVQTVDVLREERVDARVALELGERAVTRVGLGLPDAALDPVLPRLRPHLWIRQVVLDVCRLLGGRILGPHTVGAAKVGDSRLGRDTSAGEDDDVSRHPQPARDGVELVHARGRV